jgi:hypothetical protein
MIFGVNRQHSNGENHWPVASRWQSLSHNVVLSTSRPSGVQTHNVSGDRNWLHRKLWIQLPYDHDHDGPVTNKNSEYIQLCLNKLKLDFC